MDDSRIPNRIEQILSERLPERIGTVRDFERWFESSLKLRIMVAVERVHHAATVALSFPDGSRGRDPSLSGPDHA